MTTKAFDYAPGPALPRFALWIEWLILFAVFPFLYVELLEPARFAKYPFFGLPFAYAGIVWLLTRPHRVVPSRRTWRSFFIALGMVVPVAVALVWKIDPKLFFGFPRHAPRMFAVYMALYPILSVWPQEFLYRRFYFWRYQSIFPSSRELIWSNALAFCLLHAIYHNGVAVVLSLAGGWFFASEYERKGSLLLVWVEHSVFGMYLFTIGLGRFSTARSEPFV